jgi:UDP-N-acetylmuramate: L-alanyl-gamma-D-glutamyl-meso-diaminopimelate ligase
LAQSLAIADEIVMANVFKSDAIPEAERLDLGMVVEELQKHGRRSRIVPEFDAIVQLVAPELRPGDVVAILSNGGFGGIYEKLPQKLEMLAKGVTEGSAKLPVGATAKA